MPLKPGRAGAITHDYKRNGTVDLFAALNAVTGEVLTHCGRRHTHRDFLFFLKLIDGRAALDRQIESATHQ